MLRDLVVFVDDQPGSDERLRIAAMLAGRYGAQLTGVHIEPSPELPPGLRTMHIGQTMSAREQIASAAVLAAEGRFRETMQGLDVRHDWRTARGSLPELAAAHARCADLAIIGQVAPDQTGRSMPPIQPEDVALLSGRPVLILPYAGRIRTLGDRPLIAWKSTREAARAVNDSIPLLNGQATIMMVDPNADDGETAGENLALQLSRHAIAALVERVASTGRPVADVFLSRAAEIGADLLVMGAYGHSRLRELMLGGMTRDILQRMTLPVLMAH
jgi:nucleotide-binding universal stress UspA family protein